VKHPSLSALLAWDKFPKIDSEETYKRALEQLQHKMLRIQQGNFHSGGRAIIAIEGFDAAGKGGAIRRITEGLDPRGIRVVPIGPPLPEEQGRHWLYRFWRELPSRGMITVFDRTWYGRVLVERIDGLCSKKAWKRAYDEINEFEAMLVNDGIDIVKLFMAISKREQLKRFEQRLKDPYKHWKIGEADVRARQKWDDYVDATDDLFRKTDTRLAPWHLVAAGHKWYGRIEALRIATDTLHYHARWMEKKARVIEAKELKRLLKMLKG
jgi:polyphosphate kinase 2 (PPK2 family)